MSFKPPPGAHDLGYIPGKENSHSYATEVEAKLRANFPIREIRVVPRSAVDPAKVPAGYFCADIEFTDIVGYTSFAQTDEAGALREKGHSLEAEVASLRAGKG